MDRDVQSTLKWGGLAGILGSLLLLGVFALLAAFDGLETIEAEVAIARFPDIRWARIIENTADYQTDLVAAWEVSMAWVDTLVVTGLVGGYAAVAGLIEEGDIVALGVFALVFFHIDMGWKSWRLSLQS